MGIARVPRRHHTVKHIHALNHGADDVVRGANAHQVTGACFRHMGGDFLNDSCHLLLGFAHRKSAYGISRVALSLKTLQGCLTQIAVHSPLYDPEQSSRMIGMGLMTTRSPA